MKPVFISNFVTHRFIEVLSKRIYENTPVICSLLFKMKVLACSFCAVRWQRPETDESLLRLLTSAQQPRVSWVLLWKEILERSGRICFLFLQWIMGSYSIALGQGVSSWWWLLFLSAFPSVLSIFPLVFYSLWSYNAFLLIFSS